MNVNDQSIRLITLDMFLINNRLGHANVCIIDLKKNSRNI